MKQLNFIGLGVSRSGTTWTWQQLIKHPQVCAPEEKEAGILQKQNIKLFMKNYEACKGIIGEYTPSYFYQPRISQKIKKVFPDAKLLLMLRNPIDRLFTQYKVKQWKSYGRVKDTFLDWITDNRRYVNSNDYQLWMPAWVHNFDQKQLKINLFDDLVQDSLGYIQGIYKYLGVHDFVPPNYLEKETKVYNRYYERHPIEISKRDKNLLRGYFNRSILKLEEYIGRKTNWL